MSADSRQNPASSAGAPERLPVAGRGPLGGRGPMGGMGGRPTEKPKNFKGSLLRLIRYLRPHRARLAIVLAFAVASTSFAIAAPKITSKAMNKLQDAYMARTLISRMTEAQEKAASEMDSRMAEAQETATDRIITSMAGAQKEAIDGIISGLGDAQTKAGDGIVSGLGDAQAKAVSSLTDSLATAQSKMVDGIYTGMAAGFYKGMIAGEKSAVTAICTQMGTVQKSLNTQLAALMQQAQKMPALLASLDPALVTTARQLLALPLIDDQTTLNRKRLQTVAFIDLLKQMPPMPAMPGATAPPAIDAQQLAQARNIVSLPLLSYVSAERRVPVIRSFLRYSGAKSPFNSTTTAEVYARIPALNSDGSVSTTASSAGSSMTDLSTDAEDAVNDLLDLPLISAQTDPAAKTRTVVQLIDIFERLPDLSSATDGTAGGSSDGKDAITLDAASLAALQRLVELPAIAAAPDAAEKTRLVLELIDILKAMPASIDLGSMSGDSAASADPAIPTATGTGTTSTGTDSLALDTDSLDSIATLLRLPSISAAPDAAAQRQLALQLIDIFRSMPDSIDLKTGDTGSTGSDSEMSLDDASLDSITRLLLLPAIADARTPAEQNSLTRQMLAIFKTLPDDFALSGSTTGTDSGSNTALTDKGALDSVIALLELPSIAAASGEQKSELSLRMLDIFSQLPEVDMGTDDGQADADQKAREAMDPQNIATLKAYMALPRIDSLTSAAEKADVVRQVMDLGKKVQDSMTGLSTGTTTSSVSFTEDQINTVIHAIETTNGIYDFQYIGMIALILIGIYLISALCSLVMGLVMSGVAQQTSRDLRRAIDAKLNRLPLRYFDLHAHGDILSRVTNDIDTISTTLQQALTQLITSVITIVGYILMMLTISPVLTLIVIATLPLYMAVTILITRQSQKYFAAQQRHLGDLSGHVEEMYTGHKIVKAFGKEQDSIAEFESINKRLQGAGWKAQFISGTMFPLMNFISNLGYVSISIVGGIWITRGALGFGDIIAFITYSRSFTMPIVQTANIANVIQSTVACAERVFEVLDETEEVPDRGNAQALEAPKGEVAFNDVDFSYSEDVPLIEAMNLDVRQGHTIAIVGPTGAGKTTLVNLLMRFYEIRGGRISIDGTDIRDIPRSDLRRLFGMVLQDTWLFNGTIRENIAYGRADATEPEIIAAARAAHADRFIRTLPEGYDTVLNEEASNISQGQKQLLTIARAILADPAILILDEATSSVDTRTEVMIQKAMARLMEGRTSFVIAHRLSTIRSAEQILVMNRGSIIEMGNHQQLLERGGFYADLYNSQFAGIDPDCEAAV